jgi:hypothetical protein
MQKLTEKPISDRLWKIRIIFVTLNDANKIYFNPSEHLAADEINLNSKGGL